MEDRPVKHGRLSPSICVDGETLDVPVEFPDGRPADLLRHELSDRQWLELIRDACAVMARRAHRASKE